MKIIRNSILPPKGFKGITILNMIFVHKNAVITEQFIRHETIHWEQQKEMLIVFFYLWYAIEYIIRLIVYRSHNKAYKSVMFEKEAYTLERSESLFNAREHYDWLFYDYSVDSK